MATGVQPITEEAAGTSWKDVLEDILPRQGEWSEEEYLVLTDHRVRLVEFTDGKVEALPMPTAEHQMILKFLFLAFFNFFESRGGEVLFSPLRLRIRPWKFREADLLLLLSGKIAFGRVLISSWKSSATTNRSATLSTNGLIMPKAVSRSTGSSTR
jgi:hypothetical protein